MLMASIEGANCVMKGNGDTVADLRVIRTEDGRFISAWQPTPDELRLLNQGKSVLLHIFGNSHPPVYLGVETR